jgi:hypothetical protein
MTGTSLVVLLVVAAVVGANRGGGHHVAMAAAAEVATTEAGTVGTTGAVDTESSTSTPETAGDAAESTTVEVAPGSTTSATLKPAPPAPTGCDDCSPTTTTSTPDPTARLDSFTGTITVTPDHVSAGQSTHVELLIRNITDHEIDPSRATLPDNVGFACTTDLSESGHTSETLTPFRNFWFVTNPPIAPGATGGDDFDYHTTDSDAAAGTVRCEGVLFTLEEPGNVISLIGRLTNVAPVTLTVSPASTSTSAG